MTADVELRSSVDAVDWAALKADLAADRFDNGRTPDELRASFEASAHVVVAVDRPSGDVIGTARALADGVCNAYVVDVWTRSSHRRGGVATAMVQALVERVPGHHVALFTSDHVAFYEGLGFREEPTGMSLVAGHWLRRR